MPVPPLFAAPAAAAAEEAGRRLALLRAEASHHRAAASSASQALLEVGAGLFGGGGRGEWAFLWPRRRGTGMPLLPVAGAKPSSASITLSRVLGGRTPRGSKQSSLCFCVSLRAGSPRGSPEAGAGQPAEPPACAVGAGQGVGCACLPGSPGRLLLLLQPAAATAAGAGPGAGPVAWLAPDPGSVGPALSCPVAQLLH